MIERIHLVNFKNHADTQIELGKLTALIGPNSSGKTNVLQAFEIVSLMISVLLQSKEPSDEVFVQDRSVHSLVRYRQKTFRIELEGSAITTNEVSGTTAWRFYLRAPYKESWGYWVEWHWGHDSGQPMFEEAQLMNPEVLRNMEREWGNAAYLKAFDTNLKAPSYSDKIPPRVESDGSGLASAVAYFKTYEEKRFPGLLKALQSVVPSVENIRVRPAHVRIKEKQVIKVDDEVVPHVKERKVMGHELVFDMVGAREIPASSVSEGTLLSLALLTLLWSPDCPNLVLLDDIEQGLHPRAQRELIGQLRKILEQRPELQIVLTSHSPYIVDELEADEVWLLATDEEGISHAKRLSDHPEADEWLKILSTGEFWDAEGEEWILAHGE